MVDMVVHRHEMRATLARLCRLLTGSGVAARVPRPAAAKDNGYLNGSVVDGTTIESLARSYDDVLEAEPLDDGDTTRDPEKSRPKTGSRDGALN
jgi:acetyl-CoA carboxylase carboxyl transferase subunit beta